MAIVQHLVQQFSDQIVLSRAANTAAMQNVIRGRSGVGVPKPGEELAQLGGREAGSDDGAMKRRRDIPDFGPSALGIGRDEGRQVALPARQQDTGPAPMLMENRQVRHGIVPDTSYLHVIFVRI